jgi:hypothetical protein
MPSALVSSVLKGIFVRSYQDWVSQIPKVKKKKGRHSSGTLEILLRLCYARYLDEACRAAG